MLFVHKVVALVARSTSFVSYELRQEIQMASSAAVSVIIPCYNHGRHLRQAIESVLTQEVESLEVIVVNDGSTDNTVAVAASYGDSIRCINKRNAGLSAARNTGIAAARGEFIHFLDADDYIRPGMFRRMLDAAEAEPQADVFYTGWENVDLGGMPLARFEARPLPSSVLHGLLAGNLGVCHGFLVRRAVFDRVGVFDTGLRCVEDWEMWIRLAAGGCRFARVEGAFAVYRRYPGSMSTNYTRMWESTVQVLRRHNRHHRACRLCADAVARGLDAHWSIFVAPALREMFWRAVAARHVVDALRIARHVALLDRKRGLKLLLEFGAGVFRGVLRRLQRCLVVAPRLGA